MLRLTAIVVHNSVRDITQKYLLDPVSIVRFAWYAEETAYAVEAGEARYLLSEGIRLVKIAVAGIFEPVFAMWARNKVWHLSP